ncbi:hypothetical protein FB567DRAFT_596919 [Paraphoma chrysanthemicola]|uniref:Ecp2 effector protein domain-containing protein n=1 Tax=Paraphoma chrysanthemicola TaxID=798071 RepID=A0A8K0QWG9_9PLEO|nr:hypothetical protein FB567DRAFT_596919 [Paraphoma chrysanthemicola]
MKAFLKFLFGLAILGLTALINAAPTAEDGVNEHNFDLLNITLPSINMSVMADNPWNTWHDSSVAQVWLGKNRQAVGTMVGSDIYDRMWQLLDQACPAGSKFNECVNPQYVQFESRCLKTWPGGTIPCYTKIYDIYASWDTDNIRKLLIGAVAGTMEALTDRPIQGGTNCYDIAGRKGCNVGDKVLVNFPDNGADAKRRNYMHISIINTATGYGRWDCCEGNKRELVDKAIDKLGPEIINEFPQYWGKDFTRESRCIINGWDVC